MMDIRKIYQLLPEVTEDVRQLKDDVKERYPSLPLEELNAMVLVLLIADLRARVGK